MLAKKTNNLALMVVVGFYLDGGARGGPGHSLEIPICFFALILNLNI